MPLAALLASAVATAPTIHLLAQHVDPLTAEGSVSTSIGGPVTGRLEGGVALPETAPGLVSNPRRPNADAFYGTVEMVRGLLRAAAVVDTELPGSAVYVNDLGFREGGPIDHHGSHQAGRDVDVLFYMLDREGAPIPAVGVPIEPDGRGWDFHDLVDPADDQRVRIDVPRTWRFVRALLEDEEAAVQRIFVVEHVRTMLLEHAERSRAPRAVRARFEDVTCQPGYPHDDHLHVRFFCSAEDVAAGVVPAAAGATGGGRPSGVAVDGCVVAAAAGGAGCCSLFHSIPRMTATISQANNRKLRIEFMR